MLQLENNFALLTDDNDLGVSIEVSVYKDLVLVKGEFGDYKFEGKVLPSDTKYLPTQIHNAASWEQFYEVCVSKTSYSDFNKCLRHVTTILKGKK